MNNAEKWAKWGLLPVMVGVIIGLLLSYMVMPEKVVTSNFISQVEQNFGHCKVSLSEIELTLTVYADGNVVAHDTVCPGALINGSNVRSYMTREGIFFDAYKRQDLWPGDIVKVKGPYYIAEGTTLVLYGKEITAVKKVERPIVLPATPAPGNIIVVTPTPMKSR